MNQSTKRILITVLLCISVFSFDGNPFQYYWNPGIIASAESIKQIDYTNNLVFLGESLIYNPERISKVFSRHGHQVFAGMGMSFLSSHYKENGERVKNCYF